MSIFGGNQNYGKGNRANRFAGRIRTDNPFRTKFYTPNEIAANKLFQRLNGRGVPSVDQIAYRNSFVKAEQIRFMNMDVLAEVLVFINIRKNNQERIVADLNFEKMRPHVDYLINVSKDLKNLTAEGLNVARLKLMATFIRYVRYSISFLWTDNE